MTDLAGSLLCSLENQLTTLNDNQDSVPLSLYLVKPYVIVVGKGWLILSIRMQEKPTNQEI